MTDKNGKVVILGARGMLGTDLTAACSAAGIQTEGYDLPEFDICNESQLKNVIIPGTKIVNCAAYTNVEKAESEKDLAYKVNADATAKLGKIAEEAGSPVIHISTDFVFDGTLDRPYTETDKPNPISVYGASKLAGETLLTETGCDHCIIRVQWTYGHPGNNFVKKIIELAKKLDSLKVIDDQVGSPTATAEIARVIVDFLQMDNLPRDLFHYAASDYVSRYNMAKFVFDKLGIDIELKPCKTSDFQTAAARPLNSRFNCDKIQAVLPDPIKLWTEPLEKFLEQL